MGTWLSIVKISGDFYHPSRVGSQHGSELFVLYSQDLALLPESKKFTPCGRYLSKNETCATTKDRQISLRRFGIFHMPFRLYFMSGCYGRSMNESALIG